MPPSGFGPGATPSLLSGRRPTPPFGSVGIYPEARSTVGGVDSGRPRASSNWTLGVPRSVHRLVPRSVKITYVIPLPNAPKLLPRRTSSCDAVHSGPTAGRKEVGSGNGVGNGVTAGVGVGCTLKVGATVAVARGGVVATLAGRRTSSATVRTAARSMTVAMTSANLPTHGTGRTGAVSRG